MKKVRLLKDTNKRFLHKKTEVLQKVLKVMCLNTFSHFSLGLLFQKKFLSELVKNTFKSRIRNYCVVTGRSRGVFRKVRVSRICFRNLGSEGLFFGLKKASW
jgi:ribosomal protein S14